MNPSRRTTWGGRRSARQRVAATAGGALGNFFFEDRPRAPGGAAQARRAHFASSRGGRGAQRSGLGREGAGQERGSGHVSLPRPIQALHFCSARSGASRVAPARLQQATEPAPHRALYPGRKAAHGARTGPAGFLATGKGSWASSGACGGSTGRPRAGTARGAGEGRGKMEFGEVCRKREEGGVPGGRLGGGDQISLMRPHGSVVPIWAGGLGSLSPSPTRLAYKMRPPPSSISQWSVLPHFPPSPPPHASSPLSPTRTSLTTQWPVDQ